jgi:hypothetical protein
MLPREEAAQALDEIRERQRQAIDAAMIPDWYWPAAGGPLLTRRLRHIGHARADRVGGAR